MTMMTRTPCRMRRRGEMSNPSNWTRRRVNRKVSASYIILYNNQYYVDCIIDCHAFLMVDVLCQCCGNRKEVLNVDINPFMEYMRKRINVRNGLNVMDPILENFRFTNIKRKLDPGSVYVVDELCARMIEVFITNHFEFFRIFNMDAIFIKELKIEGMTEKKLASIIFNCAFYRFVSISMAQIYGAYFLNKLLLFD